MAKKQIPEQKVERTDDFADDIMSVINKQFKDKTDVFAYLSEANMVTDWVSTGCTELDLAISNRPNGGLGFGLVYEIAGLSASSKSLLAAHIMAETQKLGGLAVLYDTEKAVGMLDFYQCIGLDVKQTLYTDKLRTIEEIFTSIESIVNRSYLKNPNKPITIVVDSIMGATTMIEQEADFEKDGYATTKAIVLSKAMRKIPDLIKNKKVILVLVNQLRDNLNAGMFGEKHVTSGGKAIPFTASVRLKTTVLKKIKGEINGVPAEIGNVVEVKVIKNRLGPPGRKATFSIYYESGIDDLGSFLDACKNTGVVKSSGTSYSFEFLNPETAELESHKFMRRNFQQLVIDRPDLKQYLYDKLCELYVMKYQTDTEYTNITLEDE
jgi:recombination protein RecA